MRGIGPSLTALGVPNALADPTLELRNSNGALIIANDDWQDDPAQAAEIMAAGLAPSNNLEAAIAEALPPGSYTALLGGLKNSTGIGVVEIYDRGDGSGTPAPTPTPCITHTHTNTYTNSDPNPRILQRELRWCDRSHTARRLGGDKCRRSNPVMGHLAHNSRYRAK